jgi:trimeric autotransporter adhesin
VRALATLGSRVYIGGDFTTVGGQIRTRLASVDAMKGELDPELHPTSNGKVRTLLPSPNGSSVYVGGDFTEINAQVRPYLASLNSEAGHVRAWQPDIAPNGMVWDLEISGERLYTAEGGPGVAIAAYDMDTGVRLWRQWTAGDVQAVADLGEKVYIGGHFTSVGGDVNLEERVPRDALAAFDAASGELDQQWVPAQERETKSEGQVWAMESDPSLGRIYSGGNFTAISGEVHQGFAQFSEQGATLP